MIALISCHDTKEYMERYMSDLRIRLNAIKCAGADYRLSHERKLSDKLGSECKRIIHSIVYIDKMLNVYLIKCCNLR